MLTIGQSGSMSSMLIWIIILIVIVIIGGFVIFTLRRKMLDQGASASVGASGLLDHLHQMHKSGQIDDAEFESARSAVLRRVQDDFESMKNDKAKPADPFLDGLDLDTNHTRADFADYSGFVCKLCGILDDPNWYFVPMRARVFGRRR